MGTNVRLADALFPAVQQRVLALLFGQPERRFRSGELIRLAKGGTGGVHRLLRRLAEAGWVSRTSVGNQKHYQANRTCVAFHELHGLVVKTLVGKRAARTRTEPLEPPAARRGIPAAAPAPAPDEGWKSW